MTSEPETNDISENLVTHVEEQSSQESPKASQKTGAWKGWFWSFLALIVLVFIVGVIWLQLRTGFLNAIVQNDSRQSALTLLEQRVANHEERIASNQSAIAALNQQGYLLSSTWMLAESEYLIQFANMTLSLERNIPATIQLLEMAQSYLQKINNAVAVEVNDQLSQAISKLKALPELDINTIYHALQTLSAQVEKLPLLSEERASIPTSAVIKAPAHQSWWREGLAMSLESLKSVVIIRHRDDSIEPLMTIGQRQLVVLNIQNLFEQAELGLLNRNQEVYQGSLAQSQHLITRYFLQTNNATMALLDQVQKLSQLNIAPTMPDLTQPLIVMEALHHAEQQEQSQSQVPRLPVPTQEVAGAPS